MSQNKTNKMRVTNMAKKGQRTDVDLKNRVLTEASKTSVEVAAKHFGFHPQTVYKWKQAAKVAKNSHSSPVVDRLGATGEAQGDSSLDSLIRKAVRMEIARELEELCKKYKDS